MSNPDPLDSLLGGVWDWIGGRHTQAAEQGDFLGVPLTPSGSPDLSALGLNDETAAMQFYLNENIQQVRDQGFFGQLATSPTPFGALGGGSYQALLMLQWAQMSATGKAQWVQKMKDAQAKQQEQQAAQAKQQAPAQPGASTGSLTGSANPSQGVYLPFRTKPYVTQTFGQSSELGKEVGIDYGMNVGTPLYAPFGGKVTVQDEGKKGTGKMVKVVVTNSQGVVIGSFNIGHMTAFAVSDGQQIPAGQLIGYSGGDPSDPSSGSSSGPHIEIQWQNANGEYVDPQPFMAKLLNGVDPTQQAQSTMTYGELDQSGLLQATGFTGAGTPTGGAPANYFTSDGVQIQATQPEAQLFQMLDGAWAGTYGTAPPYWALVAAKNLNIQNASQATDLVNQLPSDINGMTNGQRADFEKLVQTYANQHLGYPVSPAYMQELASRGITSKTLLDQYFSEIPASQVPKADAATIQAAAQAHSQNPDQTPLSPEAVNAAYQASVYVPPRPRTGPQ